MNARLAMSMVALVACGGAAERTTRSPEPLEPEPRTIDEAQAQIARARSQLGSAEPAAKTEPRPEKDVAPATPAPVPAESSKASPARPKASVERAEAEESPCASSCRALASMQRAVGALCRMTGEQDERCLSARRTLDESIASTRSCHCR